jgi:hypothetical protein
MSFSANILYAYKYTCQAALRPDPQVEHLNDAKISDNKISCSTELAPIGEKAYLTEIKTKKIRPPDEKRARGDIVMQGLEWEIKSPTGKTKNTVERQLKRAAKQLCKEAFQCPAS